MTAKKQGAPVTTPEPLEAATGTKRAQATAENNAKPAPAKQAPDPVVPEPPVLVPVRVGTVWVVSRRIHGIQIAAYATDCFQERDDARDRRRHYLRARPIGQPKRRAGEQAEYVRCAVLEAPDPENRNLPEITPDRLGDFEATFDGLPILGELWALQWTPKGKEAWPVHPREFFDFAQRALDNKREDENADDFLTDKGHVAVLHVALLREDDPEDDS